MITVEHHLPVRASAAHAWDVMITHQAENHPRWEAEVLEVRPLDDIVGIGHRSVMVRKEGGRLREVVNECVEYDEGRRAAYQHRSPTMDFDIAFSYADTGPGTSTLSVAVGIQLHGLLRLMTPLFRLGATRRAARISSRTVEVIEQTPVRGKMAG
jgi:hypothetical protein